MKNLMILYSKLILPVVLITLGLSFFVFIFDINSDKIFTVILFGGLFVVPHIIMTQVWERSRPKILKTYCHDINDIHYYSTSTDITIVNGKLEHCRVCLYCDHKIIVDEDD